MADNDRNPLIIPSAAPVGGSRKGCPQCGVADWDAFSADGVAFFRCRKCKQEWSGGLPGLPQDPKTPTPPQNPKDEPNVIFTRTRESGERHVPVTIKRPDLTPSFRKGALIPGDE